MTVVRNAWVCMLSASALSMGAPAAAQSARPTVSSDGSVQVPGFVLPVSPYMSVETVDEMKSKGKESTKAAPASAPAASVPDVKAMRRAIAESQAPMLARMRQFYPVDVITKRIAGVQAFIVSPKGQAPSRRVLINAHGGGFFACATTCPLLESIPMAALTGLTVIAVDYRMAPEYRHPAGLDDILAVYREVLKTHEAKSVGLFGCSAGGVLTAQAAAKAARLGIPMPGVLGISGAGALFPWFGDSTFIGAQIDSRLPIPLPNGQQLLAITQGYFDGQDMKGTEISPAYSLDVLSKFPPTFFLAGSRTAELSSVFFSNSQMMKAKVPTQMMIQEGMEHCFEYDVSRPEARDAHQAMAAFLLKHLK